MFDMCYAILFIPNVYLGGYDKEYLDLNFTSNVNNVPHIRYYIEEVLKVRNYEIYWTFLDFDHFKELH